MTYGIVWEPDALAVAQKYAVDDRAGVQQVFRAVDLLAENPRPAGAFTIGTSGIYRIQVGFYRLQYEIQDRTVTITVFHLGRV
ncbi:type II toxin-antitoxin system RelE/ParE family toxin [Kitasatospora sp. NPDC088391]|uniref:type II toxin-antitoxin system RelE family toxin n=1 Tax=Kitasatospora sp. NPDC088391 TaxID=3364074 RepID=UPI0037FB3899